MRASLFLFIFGGIILFISCNPGNSVNSSNGVHLYKSEMSTYLITCTVVDAKNNPLPFADVHFLFIQKNVLNKGQETANPTPSTIIQFGIPDSGHATVSIFRLGTRELIATLVDTVVRPGIYARHINDSLLTNGFYICEIKCNNYFKQILMQNQVLSVYDLIDKKPLAKTDYQGKFTLPLGVFALEEIFTVTDDLGNPMKYYTISDSIGFVFYNGSGDPVVEWTQINRNSDTENTFVIQ